MGIVFLISCLLNLLLPSNHICKTTKSQIFGERKKVFNQKEKHISSFSRCLYFKKGKKLRTLPLISSEIKN